MTKNLSNIPHRYREDIKRAITILKEAGCKEVFLFGSIAEGDIEETSDIDLAIRGCPQGMFFRLLGKLMLELNHSVDLIDLDKQKDFGEYLEKEGPLLHVA